MDGVRRGAPREGGIAGGFSVAIVISLFLLSAAPHVIGTVESGPGPGAAPNPMKVGLIGGEVSLERVDGAAWTHSKLSEWEQLGLSMLRQPAPNVVIAWASHLDVDSFEALHSSDNVVVSRVEVAEFRGDNVGSGLRIVLEPRLSESIVDSLIGAVQFVAGPVEEEWRPAAGLPLSTTLLVGPVLGVERVERLLELPGIWWVEPLLETVGRDVVAASLLQTGDDVVGSGWQPAWRLGLDGSGVVVGVADSGLDLDHACFRNASAPGSEGSEGVGGVDAVGTPGASHRKVMVLNSTIDDWDDDQQDYGHGTHIAGILGCRNVDEQRVDDAVLSLPSNITSLSHGAKLLVQDVVSGDEWLEPTMDWLLAEAFAEGVVIHSDSWGDATEAYTQRSSDLDAWMAEIPWSLVFVAPGNSASAFYEPANARNAVAVAASMRSGGSDLMASSAAGPTEEGIRGMHVAAPGVSILSAASDGARDTLNDGEVRRTGTSFSTPMAASATAVIQQMVEGGWLRGADENDSAIAVSAVRPVWVIDANDSANASISLGSGSSPSGPLLKALLTLSTESLDGGMHGATRLGAAPDAHQGWGRPVLSKLVSFEALENALLNGGEVDPSPTIWLHDSFRLGDVAIDRSEWLQAGGARPLESVVAHGWGGDGAAGPFLTAGRNASWAVDWDGESDLDIVLSYAPRPFGLASDDLDLVVMLPDGRVAQGGDLVDGWSVMRDSDEHGGRDPLESTERVRIPAAQLESFAAGGRINISVIARSVGLGGSNGTVGLDGDRLGFALAVSGVIRESVAEVSTAGEGDENEIGGGAEGEGVVVNLPPTADVIEPVAGQVLAGEVVVRWKATDPEGGAMLAKVRLLKWNGSEPVDSDIGCDDVETLSGVVASCIIDVTALERAPASLWSIRISFVEVANVSDATNITIDSAHLSILAPAPGCPLCGLALTVPSEATMFEKVAFAADPSRTDGWAHWGGGEVSWDFGDGHGSSGWSVEHTYESDPAVGISGGPEHRTVTMCVSFTRGEYVCESRLIGIVIPTPETLTDSASSGASALLPVAIFCASLPIMAYLLGRRRMPPPPVEDVVDVEAPFA